MPFNCLNYFLLLPIENWEWVCVKYYGYLSFAKNIIQNLSAKYSQKIFDNVKKFTAHAFKIASKIATQKKRETTENLIGNKIADKITNTLSNNAPETNTT